MRVGFWRPDRLGEMCETLKTLQKREEYNNSKNIFLFSEARFKEHLEKIAENRYETDVIKIENVLNMVPAPDDDKNKVKKLQS